MRYFILAAGQERGPYRVEQIERMIRAGVVTTKMGLRHEDQSGYSAIEEKFSFEGWESPANRPPMTQTRSFWGAAFMLIGAVCLVYFVCFYDTSAPYTPPFGGAPERVNNLGLLQNRELGVILGALSFGVGALMAALDTHRARS